MQGSLDLFLELDFGGSITTIARLVPKYGNGSQGLKGECLHLFLAIWYHKKETHTPFVPQDMFGVFQGTLCWDGFKRETNGTISRVASFEPTNPTWGLNQMEQKGFFETGCGFGGFPFHHLLES